MNTWLLTLQNSNSPTYNMMMNLFSWFYYNNFNFYFIIIFFIMLTMINNKLINRFFKVKLQTSSSFNWSNLNNYSYINFNFYCYSLY